MRQNRPDRQKGRRLAAALCSAVGLLMLAAVILACLPVPLSRLAGYEVYAVVSGSMEPAIPVGSAVWVRPADPAGLQPGQVIAFYRGETVVVHRLIERDADTGRLTTRGDANNGVDPEQVGYSQVIGRVEGQLPGFGALLNLYTRGMGRVYMVCFAACGALLNLVAARLRAPKGPGGQN